MNKHTLLISLTFVLLFLLTFVNQHAVLSTTFLDCVEFGNTPLFNVIDLSGGKYASLWGKPLRVFSLAGNEVIFEQSVPSAERYVNVIKGDGDTLYAVTQCGTLDFYTYDQIAGLSLLSSTDLSDPASNTTLGLFTGLSLANETLIFENTVYSVSGEEQICRNIVDVSDPLSPVLISRTYVDWDETCTGFYYLNGHYIYITVNAGIYTSDTPTADLDSIDIPGLELLTIWYSMQIEDKIYIICSDSSQNYKFACLDLSDLDSPTLSLMHSTQLRNYIDMSMDSDNTICVTGLNNMNHWRVEKYLYSNQDNWQLLGSANFGDIYAKLFPITGGYFGAGTYYSLILDSDLAIQAIINETSSYYFQTLILGRYMVLSESTSYGTIGYKIFDLRTEEFLDFFNDGYFETRTPIHGANKIVFTTNVGVEVVEFGEAGISRTWSMPLPYNGYPDFAIYEDLLAMSGYVNGQWRIYIYKLTASGMELQSERVIPHISQHISFYDANHLFVHRFTESEGTYMYFYRIEQDYGLTYLDELVLNEHATLVLDNAIIHGHEGGTIIDTTDPDNPVVSQSISLPMYCGYDSSYSGYGHYILNGYDNAFILDSDYLPLGYVNGNKLHFYQSNCFINPGPAGVVKTRIDAIVANDDNLQASILPQSIRNYPNPFNPETTIEFTLPKDGKVRVTIYNVKGQIVKEILNDRMLAGKHAALWDGTDADGRAVSSGLYLARIKQDSADRVHKMMLMK